MAWLPTNLNAERQDAWLAVRPLVVAGAAITTVGAVALDAGWRWLLAAVHAARCPINAFLWGSPPPGVMAVSPVFCLFCLGGAIMLNVLGRNPESRRKINRFGEIAYPELNEPPFDHMQRVADRFALITTAVTVPWCLFAFFAQFCVSPLGVEYQGSPWVAMKRQDWPDVALSRMGCGNDFSAPGAGLVLTIKAYGDVVLPQDAENWNERSLAQIEHASGNSTGSLKAFGSDQNCAAQGPPAEPR